VKDRKALNLSGIVAGPRLSQHGFGHQRDKGDAGGISSRISLGRVIGAQLLQAGSRHGSQIDMGLFKEFSACSFGQSFSIELRKPTRKGPLASIGVVSASHQ
jgi:hypothetical protein